MYVYPSSRDSVPEVSDTHEHFLGFFLVLLLLLFIMSYRFLSDVEYIDRLLDAISKFKDFRSSCFRCIEEIIDSKATECKIVHIMLNPVTVL